MFLFSLRFLGYDLESKFEADLPLHLLVLLDGTADDHQLAVAADDSAVFTTFFDGCSYLHDVCISL